MKRIAILGVLILVSVVAAVGQAEKKKPMPPAFEAPSEAEVQKVREEMKLAGVPDPGKNFYLLNRLGYKAMYQTNDIKAAMNYFRWNLALFGTSEFRADAEDSLAEGYLQSGDIKKAIDLYSHALELKPEIKSSAKSVVTRLKADAGTLPAIKEEMKKAYIDYIESRRRNAN